MASAAVGWTARGWNGQKPLGEQHLIFAGVVSIIRVNFQSWLRVCVEWLLFGTPYVEPFCSDGALQRNSICAQRSWRAKETSEGSLILPQAGYAQAHAGDHTGTTRQLIVPCTRECSLPRSCILSRWMKQCGGDAGSMRTRGQISMHTSLTPVGLFVAHVVQHCTAEYSRVQHCTT